MLVLNCIGTKLTSEYKHACEWNAEFQGLIMIFQLLLQLVFIHNIYRLSYWHFSLKSIRSKEEESSTEKKQHRKLTTNN